MVRYYTANAAVFDIAVMLGWVVLCAAVDGAWIVVEKVDVTVVNRAIVLGWVVLLAAVDSASVVVDKVDSCVIVK